jgi:hypothetical protein
VIAWIRHSRFEAEEEQDELAHEPNPTEKAKLLEQYELLINGTWPGAFGIRAFLYTPN